MSETYSQHAGEICGLAGSLLTIFAFTFLYLYRFNRGRGWFNAAYAVAFSAAVYLLFEVVLQAGLPQGVLAPLY